MAVPVSVRGSQTAVSTALQFLVVAARHHGVHLAADQFVREHGLGGGHVKVLSEDAFTTAQDGGKTTVRPFYKATVVLDKTSLHNVPDGFRLIPGMPLTGDVIVGDRTLLSYLTHGFLRSLNEAMREP